MTTFSTVFWAGLAFDTLTVEPAKRAATPGPTVGVGAAVADGVARFR